MSSIDLALASGSGSGTGSDEGSDDGASGADASDTVTIEDVTFEANSVATSAPYLTQDGTASGLLPTATLTTLVGRAADMDLTIAPEGDTLVLGGAGSGVLSELGIVVAPGVDDGTLVVDVTELRLGGLSITPDDLPGFLADAVTEQVDGLEVPLDLPEGIELSGVEVVDEGVRVDLTGTDVPIGALAGS
ncbi:hypothetical protein GCM10025865_15290 [Paraoerskovia sediminicola]|uniref:DUF2993 domain-containing protein n=1 Tax=Paraoerskovia sediminicola TaxID=1138587 RepID=A0ABN6XBW7_9CELL|nr:DUF2993 domain-containing protein [Paraoerskovia sediminicola]BDZ42230.1 hypothetical protein GCM10025865_15290 [Paraoerskovia sediminicola]